MVSRSTTFVPFSFYILMQSFGSMFDQKPRDFRFFSRAAPLAVSLGARGSNKWYIRTTIEAVALHSSYQSQSQAVIFNISIIFRSY